MAWNQDKTSSFYDDAEDVLGFVFATSQEHVGLTDRMSAVKKFKGNGFRYLLGTWEKRQVVVVESGIGLANAQEATQALIQTFRPKRVVSAGFAGSLIPTLERGQIVLPNRLIRASDSKIIEMRAFSLESPVETPRSQIDVKVVQESFLSESLVEDDAFRSNEIVSPKIDDFCEVSLKNHPHERESNKKKSGQKSLFLSGTLVSCDQVLDTVRKKERYGQKYQASLADMETWSVAHVCRQEGVAFSAVRIILDLCQETLPREVQQITQRYQHKARLLGTLLVAVSQRPSCLFDLYKLKEQALAATDRLEEALRLLIR